MSAYSARTLNKTMNSEYVIELSSLFKARDDLTTRVVSRGRMIDLLILVAVTVNCKLDCLPDLTLEASTLQDT